jgi:hypothetical protein
MSGTRPPQPYSHQTVEISPNAVAAICDAWAAQHPPADDTANTPPNSGLALEVGLMKAKLRPGEDLRYCSGFQLPVDALRDASVVLRKQYPNFFQLVGGCMRSGLVTLPLGVSEVLEEERRYSGRGLATRPRQRLAGVAARFATVLS